MNIVLLFPCSASFRRSANWSELKVRIRISGIVSRVNIEDVNNSITGLGTNIISDVYGDDYDLRGTRRRPDRLLIQAQAQTAWWARIWNWL